LKGKMLVFDLVLERERGLGKACALITDGDASAAALRAEMGHVFA